MTRINQGTKATRRGHIPTCGQIYQINPHRHTSASAANANQRPSTNSFMTQFCSLKRYPFGTYAIPAQHIFWNLIRGAIMKNEVVNCSLRNPKIGTRHNNRILSYKIILSVNIALPAFAQYLDYLFAVVGYISIYPLITPIYLNLWYTHRNAYKASYS